MVAASTSTPSSKREDRGSIAESQADVVETPEREDRSVQHVGGGIGRVLLEKCAAPERRSEATITHWDFKRADRQRCPLGELILPGLLVEPDKQARTLALWQRREPAGRERECVRHRKEVLPGAILPLQARQVACRRDRCFQPFLVPVR